MSEVEERARVVAVARQWLRTPYRHASRVKGSGADCLTLLAEVFSEAGLISRPVIPYYPHDWHLHRDAERYTAGLLQYTHEITGPPLPGDIALWKFGRCFSHGAIVVEWPVIIHAYVGRACTIENADAAVWLSHIGENTGDRGKPRPRRFFSIWGS
jgi:cell wall-associated NlpC family hydrolase